VHPVTKARSRSRTARPDAWACFQIGDPSTAGLRGAALVAATIDLRHAGPTSPIPRALLDAVHERYLDDPEHARIPREPLSDAWAWATRQRRATATLLHSAHDRIEVFDYLVAGVQRRAIGGGHVPGPIVQAAIDTGNPADSSSPGGRAYAHGRYALAKYAYRRDWQAKSTRPGLGAEHPDTQSEVGQISHPS
jgi:hypothetical protein